VTTPAQAGRDLSASISFVSAPSSGTSNPSGRGWTTGSTSRQPSAIPGAENVLAGQSTGGWGGRRNRRSAFRPPGHATNDASEAGRRWPWTIRGDQKWYSPLGSGHAAARFRAWSPRTGPPEDLHHRTDQPAGGDGSQDGKMAPIAAARKLRRLTVRGALEALLAKPGYRALEASGARGFWHSFGALTLAWYPSTASNRD